jgi:hypothetical protein
MFPRNPKVLVDNKVLGASDVHAIVVKATLQQVDTAEITVPGPLQAPPPMFAIGANLEVKLALGDSIFTGRIVGMTPRAGLQELVIRAHGKMRLAQPPRGNDVRIAQPIKSLNMRISPRPHGAVGDKVLVSAKLTLDPEIDSVKYLLGDTKERKCRAGAFVYRKHRKYRASLQEIRRRSNDARCGGVDVHRGSQRGPSRPGVTVARVRSWQRFLNQKTGEYRSYDNGNRG